MTTNNTKEKRPAQALEMDVNDLDRWEMQPRKKFDGEKHKQLVASVKLHGVLQTIIARYTEEEGKAEIVCGERRWRAAKDSGVVLVPVSLRDLSDKEAMELSMIENVQRDDLDVFEEADGYHSLMQLGFSVLEMSQRFDRKQNFIYSRLELRKLGVAEKEAVLDGNISLRVAEGLARIESEKAREKALAQLVAPSHYSGPMPQEPALKLIKAGYIEPQKAEKAWVKKIKKLKKDFPAAEVMEFNHGLSVGRWDSAYRDIASRPAGWQVVDALGVDEDSIPTWGAIAAMYGGVILIIPPEELGGDPQHVVEMQPLIDADVAQAVAAKAIFPKPASESEAKEEEKLKAKAKVNAEELEARKLQQRVTLVKSIRRKNLDALVPVVVDYFRAQWDQEFDDVHELLTGERLSVYDDDESKQLEQWVDGELEGKGVKGFFWMLLSSMLAEGGGVDPAAVCEAMKLDAGDYPDLIGKG